MTALTVERLSDAYVESGLRHWRQGQKDFAANEWAKAGRLLALARGLARKAEVS